VSRVYCACGRYEDVEHACIITYNKLKAELAEVESAYQACLQYAKRYDWLRQQTVQVSGDGEIYTSPLWRDILDRYIDDSMRSSPQPQRSTEEKP
jgi:hypothetical protein